MQTEETALNPISEAFTNRGLKVSTLLNFGEGKILFALKGSLYVVKM